MGGSPRARGCYCVLMSPALALLCLLPAQAASSPVPNFAPRRPKVPGPRGTSARRSPALKAQLVVEAAERFTCAVVQLGPLDRYTGTGFVVSRSHRLIVTAGHAADHFFSEVPPGERAMYALPAGCARPIPVEKVWYHPRIRGELDYGLVANSLEPRDGAVAFPSPDLALIQLSQDSGELPLQCEVQIQAQPRDQRLCRRSCRFLGAVAGSSVDARPRKANSLTSLIRRGRHPAAQTAREYDDFVFMDAPCTELGGISGGPIFLASGLAVALATNAEPCGNGHEQQELVALRIECLAELATYHKLGGWFPGLAKAAPRPGWGPSPRIEELRRTASLVLQAGRSSTLGFITRRSSYATRL